MIQDLINKIHCADCLEFMRAMPGECADCIITSPPYWGLRSYGTNPQVWGGDASCEHEWGEEIVKGEGYNNEGMRWNHGHTRKEKPEAWDNKVSGGNICNHCQAWKGNLGLEPTIELYIDYLIEIFGECHRVLKNSGTCWVNIGDSYGGSNSGGLPEAKASKNGRDSMDLGGHRPTVGLPPKSLCQIPERFSIAMTDRLDSDYRYFHR